MQLKYALVLMPLMWSITIGILANGINSLLLLGGITLVSFIVSAITTVTLSSFKILDSGLGEGANKMLFIIIFAGVFYGVTVASLYIGGGNPLNDHLNYDDAQLWHNSGYTVDTLPDFIKYVEIKGDYLRGIGGIILQPPIRGPPTIIYNPTYNSSAPVEPLGNSGFFSQSSDGYGNEMFTDMPYFNVLTVILSIMYVFGIYLLVSD